MASQLIDNDSDWRSIGSDVVRLLVGILILNLTLLGSLTFPIAIILMLVLMLTYWLDSRSAFIDDNRFKLIV